MLIEENKTDETLSLTAYRAGAIEAGGKTYTAPIIWRNGKIEAMKAQTPSELTATDLFQTTSESDGLPEVIIVGTGEKQQFLHPKIAAELAAHGIGLECMNTASACRTLVLLQGEGRSVWALLWV
jgi:hypothetical protein